MEGCIDRPREGQDILKNHSYDYYEDDHMEVEEVLTSMWPEDVNEFGTELNVDRPREDQDMLNGVAINGEPTEIDLEHLHGMSSHRETGSSQLAYLVKHWEYKQANAVRLLREELDSLNQQREEAELKRLEIVRQHRFERERTGNDRHSVAILEELYGLHKVAPKKKYDVPAKSQSQGLEIDAEYDTVVYWRQKAMVLEIMLEESRQREQTLLEKLEKSIKNTEKQSTPVEELSDMLKRADNFVHFILQNAPIVLGHMDKELRYRFIYNHYPSFKEDDIIGKTDTEIFSGSGVKESLDFKREVLERGLPGKREITFDTELFGSKTFLMYAEPVFNKAGETIGVNYIGMDVTDQVRKREKMAKLREVIAVQNAMETELNKTIHITEETMRAKQMLATMSHEIRSPLSGVVGMAEVLATTNLDMEQRELLRVMISSGDMVLQLINDILDLSKVESGVMRLEATKFRPREVVRHVLQTAAASMRKKLTLEGHIADDVPSEVIGDVLRIRQILTNLVSNAIKFTHEGKVGVRLYVVPAPYSEEVENKPVKTHIGGREQGKRGRKYRETPYGYHNHLDEPNTPIKGREPVLEDDEGHMVQSPKTLWVRCDVYDTGIGIPENSLPKLFEKYMQVRPDHARKYGGTGLGLAICKQLVELMGGHMVVTSKEHRGSTFTFILPYRVSHISDDGSDDLDELPDNDCQAHDTLTDDMTSGYFQFQPGSLSSSLFISSGLSRSQNSVQNNFGYGVLPESNAVIESPSNIFTNAATSREVASLEITRSRVDLEQTSCESSSKYCDYADAESSLRSDQFQSLSMGVVANEVGQIAKSNDAEETCQMQASDRSLQSTASSKPEVPRPEEKPKILLVEDNKINVMVTTSMMKQLGHSIDVANNGLEAVHAVQNNSYDLVLMDMCMPVMDGLQATRIIRSFEETGNWDAAAETGIDPPMCSQKSAFKSQDLSMRRTPIVAMTANALSESAEECYANGMDSYVSKPVTFQKLKECLQQFLT